MDGETVCFKYADDCTIMLLLYLRTMTQHLNLLISFQSGLVAIERNVIPVSVRSLFSERRDITSPTHGEF